MRCRILRAELEHLRYEAEVAQRLLDKAADEATRETWQTRVNGLQMLVQRAAGNLEEQQQEMAVCNAMIAEIEADLGEAKPGAASDQDDADPGPTVNGA